MDGATNDVPRSDSGAFTTPSIAIDSYHSLSFSPITQYLIGFAFTDNAGSQAITPSALSIRVAGNIRNVSSFQAWLDSGSTFSLTSVIWEKADVKPLNQVSYQVSTPTTIMVSSRVYHATVKVIDFLTTAVQGARVSITLVNGTTVVSDTGSKGTVDFGLIPIGPFRGTVTNLGVPSGIIGDAWVAAQNTATAYLSYNFLGVIAVVIGAGFGGLFLLRRRSKRKSNLADLEAIKQRSSVPDK